MKFVCTQENLHQGLQVASHINTKNINLPILNNVMLEVDNNEIKLISTNLEIAIVSKIRGKSEISGSYTVPAKLLCDYINLLPKENITLAVENDFLQINCLNRSTKIKGISSQDFPIIPQIEKKHTYFAEAGVLKNALGQVTFAVLPNESRPEISGVYMNFNGESGELTLVATDSFRLTEKKIKLNEKSCKDSLGAIVPLKTIWELTNIVSNISGEDNLVEISLDEGQIFFNYNNTNLTSRLIEGIFPDYNQIIPKNFATQAVLPVKELLMATKSASLFSRSGLNDIKFDFTLSDNALDIYSTDNQTGEQKTRITCNITGADNKIVLNHKYLVDGLSNIGSNEVAMNLIDENSPCVLRPANDENYLYIIMPIKQ
jgi:DNA polymerase-3 subunit beta